MRIAIAILLIIFISGCGMTGRVVEEVQEQSSQQDTDKISLTQAIAQKDVTKCYGIQNQPIRESCFIQLAQITNDTSICNNLFGRSLKNTCKKAIQ